MKKLMIAAAMVASAVSAFGYCGDPDQPDVTSRQVYTYKFTGKTTKGVWGKAAGNLCGDPTEACVQRIPTKMKIQGWVALCDTKCSTIIDTMAAPAAKAFWMTKPYKGDIADAATGLTLLNVIGKKPSKAEAAGVFTGTVKFAENVEWALGDGLTYAGLGKYNKKNGTYSKISGNFAGQPVASWYVGKGECAQTSVWDCETLSMDCDNKPNTVAFGKVTIKYSSSATKKFYKGKTPKTPSYASVVAE